jgi:hypothetical protein
VLPFLLYRSHKVISENTSILQEIYMWLSVSKLQISKPLKMKKKKWDYIEMCNQSNMEKLTVLFQSFGQMLQRLPCDFCKVIMVTLQILPLL